MDQRVGVQVQPQRMMVKENSEDQEDIKKWSLEEQMKEKGSLLSTWPAQRQQQQQMGSSSGTENGNDNHNMQAKKLEIKETIEYPRIIETYDAPPGKGNVMKKEKHPSLSEIDAFVHSMYPNNDGILTVEDLSKKYKEDGLMHFKEKRYQLAILCFTEAITNVFFSESKEEKLHIELLAQLYNNRSASHYFLENYESSLDDALSALKVKPNYFKPMFRQIQCFIKLEKYKSTIELCRQAEIMFPQNITEVQKLYQGAKEKLGHMKLYKLKTFALNEDEDGEANQNLKEPEKKNQKVESKSRGGIPRPLNPVFLSAEEENELHNYVKQANLEIMAKSMAVIFVPPKPKLSIQFFKDWNFVKHNPEMAAKYMKQMTAEDFKMFKNSMECDVLAEILDLIVWEFLRKEEFKEAIQVMEGLLFIQQLGILITLLSQKDRANLRNILSVIERKDLFDIYQDRFDILN